MDQAESAQLVVLEIQRELALVGFGTREQEVMQNPEVEPEQKPASGGIVGGGNESRRRKWRSSWNPWGMERWQDARR